MDRKYEENGGINLKKISFFVILFATFFLFGACASTQSEKPSDPTFQSENTTQETSEIITTQQETTTLEKTTTLQETTTLEKTTALQETTTQSETTVQEEPQGVFLNQVLQSDTKNIYTYTSNFGNMFEFVVSPTENEVLILGMVVAEQYTTPGLVLDTTDLCTAEYNENALLCLIYTNTADGTYAEYYSASHPEVFKNIKFELKEYNFLQNANYLLSADVVVNGTTYSLSGTGSAEYTENANNPQHNDNDTCTYCGGSGVCHVCNGIGYTTWGGYDNRIDCTACDVPGDCYYCQGTGIQVYIVRGVLKQ